MNNRNYLIHKSKFRGKWTPENVVFDDNLQEFSQRVGFICALESNGKLSPIDAYRQIKQLFKQLKKSKRGLNIDGQ